MSSESSPPAGSAATYANGASSPGTGFGTSEDEARRPSSERRIGAGSGRGRTRLVPSRTVRCLLYIHRLVNGTWTFSTKVTPATFGDATYLGSDVSISTAVSGVAYMPGALGPDVVRVLHLRREALEQGALVTIDKIQSRVRVLPIRTSDPNDEPG